MTMKTLLKKIEPLVYLNDKLKTNYHKYFCSDKGIIKKRFKQRLEREVNLDKPSKYNDKLQWLKLYWRDPFATKCADKYKVREFVRESIGERYLNDLFDVYESVNQIDLSKLPTSFVLKGTHGSGYNIICKDKNKMDWDKEFKKMRRWMWNNYYWSKREWVYKDIKPRIICERYMEDEHGELRDYKIFCFNGEPKIIEVDFDRFTDHRRNIYDLEWNLLDVEIEHPSDKEVIINRPETLDEMLELSRKLSKTFPHVRVDFYNVNGKIIFGELTFFHESGMGKFNPPEFEKELGRYLKLP